MYEHVFSLHGLWGSTQHMVLRMLSSQGFLPPVDRDRLKSRDFTDFIDSLRLRFDIISTMTNNNFFQFRKFLVELVSFRFGCFITLC